MKYSIGERIGHGGYGEVFAGTKLATGDPIAVKIAPQDTAMLNEIMTTRSLASQYVIEIDDVYATKTKLCAVMKLGDRDLRNAIRLGMVNDSMVMPIVEQLIRSVAYIHSMNVVHCDIKTANYVMFGSNIKLIDFGLACTGEVRRRGGGYTVPYRPPEMMIKCAYGRTLKTIDRSSDIWALGCCIFEVLTGMEMFAHSYDEKDREQTYINDVRTNREDRLDLIFGSPVVDTSLLRTIVGMMTHPVPRSRPSAAEVLEMLGMNIEYEHAPMSDFWYDDVEPWTDEWKTYRENVLDGVADCSNTIEKYLLAVYIFDRYSVSTNYKRFRNIGGLSKNLASLASLRVAVTTSSKVTVGMIGIANALNYRIEYPNLLTDMVKSDATPSDGKQMARVKEFVYNRMYDSDVLDHYDEYILV
uniref:Protein kinase domain-containing protein n=1 Tax=viral metagenome TaxID=1070528 RepID=A0A6C0LXW1_9ZZZZ